MKENFIIKPDGSKHVITPKNRKKFELEELQEIVGGYIEVIRLNNKHNQCMIVNEMGKLYNLEHNAVRVCHRAQRESNL